MKLSRKHELALIELGIQSLIDKTFSKGQVKAEIQPIPKIKKKLHWTQTAAGKAKMAKSMRNMWKVKKSNGKI